EPELPYRIYMTRRLILRPISFLAYVIILYTLVIYSWLLALTLFFVLLALQFFSLWFYRRKHSVVLHDYLGREETTRLQLFSDAIFAVAMTLLIAQIDPQAEINEIWSLVGSFVFIIFFLAVLWLLHYRLFHYVRQVNGNLIAMNFFF